LLATVASNTEKCVVWAETCVASNTVVGSEVKIEPPAGAVWTTIRLAVIPAGSFDGSNVSVTVTGCAKVSPSGPHRIGVPTTAYPTGIGATPSAETVMFVALPRAPDGTVTPLPSVVFTWPPAGPTDAEAVPPPPPFPSAGWLELQLQPLTRMIVANAT
jgi:hypothetical protein